MEAANYTTATGAVADIAASDITGVTNISVAGVGTVNAALVISTQDSANAIGVQGYSDTVAGTATGGAVNWASGNYKTELADVITQLEAYDNELKTQASALANNLSTITTREEFSTNMINTLTEGSDKLTLADLNEEGANLLALQTQNQLATQSLSLASQQSQSVLQLIG
jgi:flagellin-like hook-associated protein FlgL